MLRRSATFLTLSLIAILAASSAALAVEKSQRAPALKGKDTRGKMVDLASLRGKVVVVDFWASWCGPCKVEMPVLERLYRKYKSKGLVVIGVSVDRERENMLGFLKKTKVSFPVLHDADHSISGRFSPPKMPSSYVIDKKGIVRHVHEGFRKNPDSAKLEAEIKSLL